MAEGNHNIYMHSKMTQPKLCGLRIINKVRFNHSDIMILFLEPKTNSVSYHIVQNYVFDSFLQFIFGMSVTIVHSLLVIGSGFL